MNGIHSNLDIVVVADAREAVQSGYFYRPPVYKPITIEKAVVVQHGTASGKPTVDIVLRDERGQLYACMITSALLRTVVDLGDQPKQGSDGSAAPEYQLRALKQADTLAYQLSALVAFMESPDFLDVDAEEQFLMIVQRQGMTTYQTALDARIKRWKLPAPDDFMGDSDEHTPD